MYDELRLSLVGNKYINGFFIIVLQRFLKLHAGICNMQEDCEILEP